MLVCHSGALLNISSEEVEAACAVVGAAAKVRGASLVRVKESIAETTIVDFYGFVRGEKSADTIDLSQLRQFALRVQLSAS